MIKGLKLSMKQMLIFVLIICLVLPQAALAIEAGGNVSVPNSSFSDTNNHWAKKFISKIALLRFAQGNDGKFRPEDPISQQEAIIMITSMMGKQDEINDNAASNLPIEVAPWAQPYVVLALNEKLITMSEELASITSNWGAEYASREWITKLIVRAIGQQDQAELANDDNTGFTDEDVISDGYIGFINIALSLSIVNGLPDGSFNPNGQIKRAEMAVLLAQAEQHLDQRSVMISSGTVVSSNAFSIQIEENTGLVKNYTTHPNAEFYTEESNNPIQVSGITVGDYLTIIHDQGIAYYVEISDEKVTMESFIGTMESISRIDLTVSLNIDGASQSFKYAADVEVTNEVKGLSLSDLTVGSTLELKRISGSTSTDITHIVVKAAPVFKTVVGTIDNVQTIDRIVKVKETSTGTSDEYQIPTALNITNGTRTLASLSELNVGDEVTVELKDDVVTSFTVTKASIIVEEGVVRSVNVTDEIITLFAPDNKFVGYSIDKAVIVLITGLAGADLADIQEDDSVLIQLNGNNLVTKITVLNRSIETKLGLEFFSYDEDANIVYLKKDKNAKADDYKISDSTVLEVGSTTIAIANINTFFTKGKKVDITYSGNRIMAMAISTKYDGELLSINTTTKTIRINSDYYGDLSLSYTTVPTVEVFGKTNASLSDLTIGSDVQIILDSNQEKATQIKLFSTQIYKVATKYSYKLTVTGETSTTSDIFNTSSIPITHHSKPIATYADITDNMYIEATMAGTTTTAIYIPAVTVGKLTAVNASGGTITVEEYGKIAKTISNITSVRVVKNATVSTTLSTAVVNDRVEVVVGNSGSKWITVITPVKKTLLGYTDATKTVELSRALLTDQNKFVLADNAYIHKGTTVLAASSLAKGSELMIYFLNGKIVEIEKI